MRAFWLFGLLLASCAAWAEDWVPIGEAQGGIQEYVDAAHVELRGDVRFVSVKRVVKPHTVRYPRRTPDTWLVYFLRVDAINCAKGTMRVETDEGHFDDGSIFKAPWEKLPTPWKLVSQSDDEFKFACASNVL